MYMYVCMCKLNRFNPTCTCTCIYNTRFLQKYMYCTYSCTAVCTCTVLALGQYLTIPQSPYWLWEICTLMTVFCFSCLQIFGYLFVWGPLHDLNWDSYHFPIISHALCCEMNSRWSLKLLLHECFISRSAWAQLELERDSKIKVCWPSMAMVSMLSLFLVRDKIIQSVV